MAQIFEIHPKNPHARTVEQAARILRSGGIVAMPTDSSYALACRLGDKDAMERMRRIRGVGEDHLFTLMCRDLAEIAKFARVDNACYRLLKAATPGAYVFILEGTRELPRRVMHPKRKTVGLRVPDHAIAQALLAAMDEPLLSTSLILAGEEEPLTDPVDIAERLDREIEAVIDGGGCAAETTTVVDLSGDAPELVRRGRGDPALLGID